MGFNCYLELNEDNIDELDPDYPGPLIDSPDEKEKVLQELHMLYSGLTELLDHEKTYLPFLPNRFIAV